MISNDSDSEKELTGKGDRYHPRHSHGPFLRKQHVEYNQAFSFLRKSLTKKAPWNPGTYELISWYRNMLQLVRERFI